jgi:hypothetical protein
MPGRQVARQGRLVDDAPAAGIEDHGAGPQGFDDPLVEQMPCRIGSRAR